MTKDGNNARKRAARELAAAEQIPYTEALRRAAPDSGITVSTGTRRAVPPTPTLAPTTTMIGHTNGVSAVAFHPRGHLLVSGGDGARLWRTGTRETTTVLEDGDWVGCVAFHPGGEIIAVGHKPGMDVGKVSLWSTATGEVVTLSGFSGGVESVVFSPDGRTLAVGTQGSSPDVGHYERVVHLYDLATRRATVLARRSDSYGAAVAFHPGGDLLVASGGQDGSVDLWNLETGETAALTGHAAGVHAVAFDPAGGVLATGSVDQTIRLWDVATGRTTAVLEPRSGYVVAVAFSPDGRTLAACCGGVRLWDVGTSAVVAVLHGHTGMVNSVAFSPGGRTLATAGADRTVRLWDLG